LNQYDEKGKYIGHFFKAITISKIIIIPNPNKLDRNNCSKKFEIGTSSVVEVVLKV